MSRMIPKAATLACLVAAASSGMPGPSRAQVIDLRLPPFATGRPGQSTPQRYVTTGFERIARPYRPVGHQPIPEVATPVPGFGAFPAIPGPIGHGGAFPEPQFPGGFPGASVPPTWGGAPGVGGGCSPGVSPVIGAVDALIGQVAAFLQVFGPTAHCVPEGDCIYRDALALYESAVAFRQAALAGASPCDLRRLYQAMDRSCCLLVSRVERIARGRTGPNIEQVRLIAALCNQIRAFI